MIARRPARRSGVNVGPPVRESAARRQLPCPMQARPMPVSVAASGSFRRLAPEALNARTKRIHAASGTHKRSTGRPAASASLHRSELSGSGSFMRAVHRDLRERSDACSGFGAVCRMAQT